MVRLSPAFEQSMIFVVFLICVFCTNLCFASDDLDEAKPRRGGTVGLFAYPRVGRSDPSMINWENVPNSYEEYDGILISDQPKFDIKRQGLFPFPRVGRADNNQLRKWSKLALQQQQALDKRSGASANSGLWFGPRLGRIQKRSAGMPGDHF